MSIAQPFKDKVAIVTGGSRGIGRAIADRLAAGGASVLLTAQSADGLRKVADEITAAGGRAAFLAIDLRLPGSAAKIVDAALAAFGGIDIVVNNAGAAKRGHFLQLADDDWIDGFALKFYGAVRLSRAAWPHLKASRGSILNVIGTGGRTPRADYALAGSVNSAFFAVTKALADLGVDDGVQVNALNPGPVHTDRLRGLLASIAAEQGISLEEAGERLSKNNRAVRIGEPSDIAALAAFVLSPAGRLLQGSLIDIDGGTTKSI